MKGLELVRGAVAALALAPVAHAAAQALPYLPTGDVRLRHEVQLAVDEGRLPLGTTWPIPTRDIPEDARTTFRSTLQPGSGDDAGWFASAAAQPTRLRTYSDTPRENGEVGLQAGWAAGDYAGGAFRVSYAIDPQDGKHLRFDDTYAGWRFGNWWATAGWQQRWWGPGHDGSLILSNNARPMFQLALERAEARPPEWSWLKWLGPYRWTTFMGKLEEGQSGFPHPLVWGLRATVRPFDKGFELGLSRTAQWCRPGVCDLSAFKDVVLGRDNQGENVAANQEPGNQLAGFDFRWKLPIGVPLAVYWQLNGESIDNRNWRPRKQTQLFGFETWARPVDGGGSWRAFLEYGGTSCGDIGFRAGNDPEFGCAYENGVFTEGYRRRGRVIGHSAESDARLYTVGGLYADTRGRTWELRLRTGELNRGSTSGQYARNTVSPVKADLWNAEAKVTGRWKRFTYDFGVGTEYRDRVDRDPTVVGRAFLNVSAPW